MIRECFPTSVLLGSIERPVEPQVVVVVFVVDAAAVVVVVVVMCVGQRSTRIIFLALTLRDEIEIIV